MRRHIESHEGFSPPRGFRSNMGNAPSQYQAASPNHNRLTKSRPNSGQPVRASTTSFDPVSTLQSDFHASFDSLKSDEARHALRRSLTSTFPEASIQMFQDQTTSRDISSVSTNYRRSQHLSEGMRNHGARPLTNSMHGPTNIEINSSSRPLQFHENRPLDVEATISLLQELKKSATPEELVALHKALLPTRDAASSPTIESPSNQSHFERGRTSHVPGLATRGGPGEDILRRPGDTPTVLDPWSNQHSPPKSPHTNDTQRRPSPLNLARPPNNPVMQHSENHSTISLSHTGAYGPGTLRVINGLASPSLSARGGERAISPVSPEQNRVADHSPRADDVISDDYRPSPMSDHFPLPAYNQSMQPSPRQKSPSPASLAPPTQYEAPSPTRQKYVPYQARSASNERLLPNSEQAGEEGSETPRPSQPLVRRGTATSTVSAISQEYLDLCDIPATPFEEIPDLPKFSTRVSGEVEDDLMVETSRADALSVLTGGDTQGKTQSNSLRGRPAVIAQSDSGYGSDSSFHSAMQHVPDQAGSPPTRRASNSTLGNAVAGSSESDRIATLQEALQTAPPDETGRKGGLSGLASKGKRRMTLFRSLTSRNTAVPTLNDVSGMAANPPEDESVSEVRKEGKENNKLRKSSGTSLSARSPLQAKDSKSKPVPDLSQNSPAASEVSPKAGLQPSNKKQKDRRSPSPSPTPSKSIFSFAGRSSSRGRQHSSTVGHRRSKTATGPVDRHDSNKDNDQDQEQIRGRSKSRKRRSLGLAFSSKFDIKSASSAAAQAGNDEAKPVEPSASMKTHKPRRSRILGNWEQPSGKVAQVRTKSHAGMSEEMAAQLARMKSKDRAGKDWLPESDHPRMARPEKKKENRSQSQPRLPDRRVEDFIPGWESVNRPPRQQKPVPSLRPRSMILDTIPPMPDIPANAHEKAQKADRLMADKMGAARRASPDPSLRSNLKPEEQSSEVSPKSSLASVQAGSETPSKEAPKPRSDATMAARSSKTGSKEVSDKSSDPKLKDAAEQVAKPKATWKTVRDPAMREQKVKGLSVEMRAPNQQPSSPAKPAETNDMSRSQERPSEHPQPASVDVQAAHGLQSQEPTQSPSIVVSRYITPQANDLARLASDDRPTDAARQHADLYMGLLHSEHEKANAHTAAPIPTRNDSAISTPSKQTQYEPVANEQQVEQGHAVQDHEYDGMPRTASPSRSPSPGTAISGWVASTGAAHKHNKESLSRLNGPFQYDEFAAYAPATPPSTRRTAVPDRYDGGLGYGWDKESRGIIGSAGTRGHGPENNHSPKKSVQLSEDWGLDLSDVPVFLRKVQ